MRGTQAALLLALLFCTSGAWAQGQGRGHGQNNAPGQNKDKGGVNIERCKGFGRDAGQKAAQVACDLTQVRHIVGVECHRLLCAAEVRC